MKPWTLAVVVVGLQTACTGSIGGSDAVDGAAPHDGGALRDARYGRDALAIDAADIRPADAGFAFDGGETDAARLPVDVYWGFEDNDSYLPITDYSRSPSNGCFGGQFDAMYRRNMCVSTADDAPEVIRNERVSSLARRGRYSFRAQLFPSDPDDWPSSEATHRSELSPQGSNPFGWEATQDLDADLSPIDRWYGFSNYIPESVGLAPPDAAADTRYSIVQWQHGTAGSPAVSIHVRGDRFVLVRHFGTAPSGLTASHHELSPVERGVWNDWVVHIRWHRENGMIQVWRNGELQFDASGVGTVHQNISNVSRMKLGIYYWRWKTRSAVIRSLDVGIVPCELFVDEVRMYQGNDRGYERVAPSL